MSSSPAVLIVNPVFINAGVSMVGMIDDAFDVPSLKDTPKDALASFWAEIDDDEQISEALDQTALRISRLTDIDDEMISHLWKRRNVNDAASASVKKLFSWRDDIDRVAGEIRDGIESLNLQVRPAGTEQALADEDQCKIILLDYYLGTTGSTEAIERAIQRAITLYRRREHSSEKPVVVLMSSKELDSNQVAEFRAKSELLGGMFHHVPKADLVDRDRLERKLLAITMSLPVAPHIEVLIRSVENALDDAKTILSGKMRSLSLEDYAYIERLSLKEDGQPFGDYIIWLFGAELYRIVFEGEAVKTRKKAVDQTRFTSLPIRQTTPSTTLTQMYSTALFQALDAQIATHPHGTKDNESPLLELGDIFIGEDSKIYMVLNPECDLAYSPGSNDRPFSATKSIILVPGNLRDLHTSLSDEDARKSRTELFEHNGKQYRILWDTKRVETQPYGEVLQWTSKKALRRLYRLRLMYALQVQQRFTAEFGRVGPPVAPPIFSPIEVEVYCVDENGDYKAILGPLQDVSAIVSSRDGSQCVLGLTFLERLLDVSHEAVASINKRIQAIQTKADEAQVPIAGTQGRKAIPADKLPVILERYRTKQEDARKQLVALEQFCNDKAAQLAFIAEAKKPVMGEVVSIAPSELFALTFERTPKGKSQEEHPAVFVISIKKVLLNEALSAAIPAILEVEPPAQHHDEAEHHNSPE